MDSQTREWDRARCPAHVRHAARDRLTLPLFVRLDALDELLALALGERAGGAETCRVENVAGASAQAVLRIHRRSSSEQTAEQTLWLALDHDSAAAGSQDTMHFLRAAETLLGRHRVQHVTDHDDIERVGIEWQHGPGCRERLDEMTVSLDGACRSRRDRRARIHDNRSTGQPGLAGQGADEGGIASAQHQ